MDPMDFPICSAAMMIAPEHPMDGLEALRLDTEEIPPFLPTLSTALMLRTIKESAEVAALVHEVSFGTIWSAHGEGAERCEAAMLRVVMLTCPNIKGLDLELLHYGSTMLSSSHIKDVVVDCRARTFLTALDLVVNRIGDLNLLDELNSLKRVGFSYYNVGGPNSFLQVIKEGAAPPPSFRLEALHLVCPGSQLRSTFNFLTT